MVKKITWDGSKEYFKKKKKKKKVVENCQNMEKLETI